MSHDKVKAAARKRMAETGEPYAAARRAVQAEHNNPASTHEAAEADGGSQGYTLRMSDEIHDWLVDLRRREPAAAVGVGQALTSLMTDGAALADPLVVSTADAWPWALAETLDGFYHATLEQTNLLRRSVAEAATLAKDIQDHLADLELARAKLQDRYRRALGPGTTEEAARASAEEAERVADQLAAIERQAARLRQLLPGVIKARDQLTEASRRSQARADSFRVRKEVLTASFVAAHSTLLVTKSIAASDLTSEDDRQAENADETIGAAQARLDELTAKMEQELGHQAWPEGLMELRPGAPEDAGIAILFAVEPVGTALLIAVLEGPEALRDCHHEALLLSADILRQVRAGQAPEATARAYPNARSLFQGF